MAEKSKGGRPKTLVRRHKIELPPELLALAESFSKDFKKPVLPTVAGAALTAAGVFLLTMATASIVKQVVQDVFRFGTGFAFKTINFFTAFFKATTAPTSAFFIKYLGLKPGETEPPIAEEEIQSFSEQVVDKLEERLPGITMLSISIGITAGGMVLAGQNPAELIKGIAALIDGLIPG